MSRKIYIKRGQKNYKENKMVTKIEKAIADKLSKDPSFADDFKPATNPAELQALYDKYVVEDVQFEEIGKGGENTSATKNEETKNTMSKTSEEYSQETKDDSEDNSTFIDPMNREEPIVPDYVLKDELPNPDEKVGKTAGKTSFDEPTTFNEQFELPEDSKGQKQNTQQGGGGSGQQKQEQKKSEPINPQFDTMNNAKKKRSAKRFAKYIVETVCMLAEKGFVWYANKDINEAKLVEYEANGEMDLSILVTLEDNQQATVRQFFQMQCARAEQLCGIDKDEKEDLIEALELVLLEKGVAPTPTQELLLISLKIFGEKAVTLVELKSQTSDLLSQLRAMKKEETSYQDVTLRPDVKPTVDETQNTQKSEVKDEQKNPEQVITEHLQKNGDEGEAKEIEEASAENHEIGTEIKTLE